MLSLELQWLTLFYYAITGIVDMDFSGQFGHLLVSKMEYVDCIVLNCTATIQDTWMFRHFARYSPRSLLPLFSRN